MKRDEVLDQVKQIMKEQSKYIIEEKNFSAIAVIWSKYTECELDTVDVARMMVLYKLFANPQISDNYLDLIGYAALAVELMGDELFELT